MGVPRLHSLPCHRLGPSMYSGGVVVHCPSSLGAAAAVLDAELPCSHRVLTNYTLESAKTVHHFDRVMSHTSSVVSHRVTTL